MKNLAELIAKAHAQSVKSGFWGHEADCIQEKWASEGDVVPPEVQVARDGNKLCYCGNRDLLMKIDLIHSELAEALEEYRLTDEKRGGPLGAVLYSCAVRDPTQGHKGDASRFFSDGITPPACCGKPAKPEGFVVELADAAIRIFDLIGRLYELDRADYGWETVSTVESYRKIDGDDGLVGERFAYNQHKAHRDVADAGDDFDNSDWLSGHNKLCAVLTRLEQMVLAVDGDLNAAIEIKMAYNATREFKHGGKRV